jgi:hypothetical protein
MKSLQSGIAATVVRGCVGLKYYLCALFLQKMCLLAMCFEGQHIMQLEFYKNNPVVNKKNEMNNAFFSSFKAGFLNVRDFTPSKHRF